jgi:oligopeptidase B
VSVPIDLAPPLAPRHPEIREVHGDRRVDDYYWMRSKDDPELRSYLQAENDHADRWMAPTEALQAQLFGEIVGRIQETDHTPPYRRGGHWYYARTTEGLQYRRYVRRAATHHDPARALDEPAAERDVLDVNQLAEGKAFMAVGALAISDDERWLAYTTDDLGFRDYTLRVRDLERGEDLPLAIPNVSSVAWAGDGRSLLYALDGPTKRPYRVMLHTLGQDPATDVELLRDDDERFRVGVARSRCRSLLWLVSASATTSEWRFVAAPTPTAPATLVAAREPDHEYDCDHRDGELWIRTNDRGRTFRVVRAPLATPGRAQWREVLAPRDHVTVEAVDAFQRWVAVSEREEGLTHVRVLALEHADVVDDHRVSTPDPVYELELAVNVEFDPAELMLHYETLATPPQVEAYDVRTRARRLIKRQAVLGGYDPARYVIERHAATAPDGVTIPISTVRRRDLAAGPAPLLLHGYGAYGIPYPIGFSSSRVSLLDRGVIVGIAHVRGGGDLGKPWHDAGRLAHKHRSFSDFVACADHLVAAGITDREHLAIEGGSAGGLLVTAALNLRPDLCKAALAIVPFVDVLETMLDESLPLTVGEYEEWGNPQDPAQYRWIRAYSPIDNLRAGAYPALLVRTSLHDSQVMVWEPAKYVAKLRALKTDRNPLVFHTNLEAGHGGASGRYDAWRETAYEQAFVLWQLGLLTPPRAVSPAETA